MYQVISIGSALVDILIHSKNFKSRPSQEGQLLCQMYGDKMEVESFNVYTGGGGSNTSVGFARMGFKTGVVCETGRDGLAELVLAELQAEGVGTKLVIEEKKEQTGGSVILVGLDGERTVMVHRGASSLLDPYDIPTFWLTQARWLHLTSIAGRVKTIEKIFQLVGREPELGLSWNPGKQELLLLENKQISVDRIRCQIMLLNRQEWQMISSVQKEILIHVPQVVITDGKKGGEVYFQGEHHRHYQATSDHTLDNLGAGDAFAVGYVSGQILGKTIDTSIKMGAANSASVVKYYGAKAGLLTADQILT